MGGGVRLVVDISNDFVLAFSHNSYKDLHITTGFIQTKYSANLYLTVLLPFLTLPS